MGELICGLFGLLWVVWGNYWVNSWEPTQYVTFSCGGSVTSALRRVDKTAEDQRQALSKEMQEGAQQMQLGSNKNTEREGTDFFEVFGEEGSGGESLLHASTGYSFCLRFIFIGCVSHQNCAKGAAKMFYDLLYGSRIFRVCS